MSDHKPWVITLSAGVAVGDNLEPCIAEGTGLVIGFVDKETGDIYRPMMGFERDLGGTGEAHDDLSRHDDLRKAGLGVLDYITTEMEKQE